MLWRLSYWYLGGEMAFTFCTMVARCCFTWPIFVTEVLEKFHCIWEHVKILTFFMKNALLGERLFSSPMCKLFIRHVSHVFLSSFILGKAGFLVCYQGVYFHLFFSENWTFSFVSSRVWSLLWNEVVRTKWNWTF